MKKLGYLNVCGVTYTVKCGSPMDCDSLDRAYGLCSVAAREIWVHNGMSPEKTLDTITHEAIHAMLAESGVLQMLELAGIEDTTKLEEAMVRVLTPHVSALFGPPQLSKKP